MGKGQPAPPTMGWEWRKDRALSHTNPHILVPPLRASRLLDEYHPTNSKPQGTMTVQATRLSTEQEGERGEEARLTLHKQWTRAILKK